MNECTIYQQVGARAFYDEFDNATFNYAKLWNDPDIQTQLKKFFMSGLLASKPHLANLVLNEFERAFSNPEKTEDVSFEAALQAIVNRNSEDFAKAIIDDDRRRITRRSAQIRSVVPSDFHPESILDVGAGNGILTSKISCDFHIVADNTYAIEVAQFPLNRDVKWLQYGSNAEIPLPDSSIDLALLLMVLHHAVNPVHLLHELFRVMAENSLLLIRETNSCDHKTQSFNELIDRLFYNVFQPVHGVPMPPKYKTAIDWINLCLDAGFNLENFTEPEPTNPFAPFFLVLRKY